MPTKAKKAERPLWMQVMDALDARPDLRRDIVDSIEDWRVMANAMDTAQSGGSRFARSLPYYSVKGNLNAAVVDAIRATVFEACGCKGDENGVA